MGRLEALPTHGNGFVMAVFQVWTPQPTYRQQADRARRLADAAWQPDLIIRRRERSVLAALIV